ncbi:hypothetical protein GCM10009801_48500 [Streptomyces albiaxialis]|uniref:Transposase n=1 Tax=Streptomyces albiaxialis TaxID=329523 RepID=A0ABN2W9H9_9ACTN
MTPSARRSSPISARAPSPNLREGAAQVKTVSVGWSKRGMERNLLARDAMWKVLHNVDWRHARRGWPEGSMGVHGPVPGRWVGCGGDIPYVRPRAARPAVRSETG